MKIADLEIKDQEFGETTKEPGLVSNFDRSEINLNLTIFRHLLWVNLMV